MSVPATEAVTTGMFATPDAQAGKSTSNGKDKDMFLQLMVAQMKYQDPSNPTDSSQFLAQTAQFTALEKMQDVADKTAQLFSAQVSFGASGLIGRTVTWAGDDGKPRTGTVHGVTFGAEGPVLDVGNGTSLPIAGILSVSDGSASTDSSSSTPTA